ncbi:MAG: IgGFc-binding protein, partial [Polyangiaceae bacterium]
PACDHLEQSVFPAETLGKQYFVPAPTGPNRSAVARVVRIYGNVDGTTLTYAPSMPPHCPSTIGAGEVVDCGVVTGDFEVTGSSEFAVGSFQLGGTVVDVNQVLGDPSQSLMASVEQYRTKYVFLAPLDYEENFADVVLPLDTTVTLDGVALAARSALPIAGGYGILRVSLEGVNARTNGAHVLESSDPVGLQVLGYGSFTSYQYPGGLNLKQIAPPPPLTK